MGWKPEEGYYQKYVNADKISQEQRLFNKLSPDEVREGIEIAEQQFRKDMEHAKYSKLEMPYSKLKKEPIEYIVEEEMESMIDDKKKLMSEKEEDRDSR